MVKLHFYEKNGKKLPKMTFWGWFLQIPECGGQNSVSSDTYIYSSNEKSKNSDARTMVFEEIPDCPKNSDPIFW